MASSSSAGEKKKIVLQSQEKKIFEVEEIVALESTALKNMIDVGCADSVIPLENVTGPILAKVIEYCKKHVDARDNTEVQEDLKKWDAEFLKANKKTIFDLVMAANYLEIPNLLQLTCQAVANLIKDMSPEQVRKIFNIKNDFTPEEEARVRSETPWAFE